MGDERRAIATRCNWGGEIEAGGAAFAESKLGEILQRRTGQQPQDGEQTLREKCGSQLNPSNPRPVRGFALEIPNPNVLGLAGFAGLTQFPSARCPPPVNFVSGPQASGNEAPSCSSSYQHPLPLTRLYNNDDGERAFISIAIRIRHLLTA